MASHKNGTSRLSRYGMGGDQRTRDKVKRNTKPGPKHGGKPRKTKKVTATTRAKANLRKLGKRTDE